MSTAVKLAITTGAGLLLIILLVVVDRGDRGETDAHLWRGGETDGIRQLMMTREGRLRPWTKPLAAALLIGFVSIIWLVL